MRVEKLDQMSLVLGLLYDQEFRSIGALLAEESTLRGQLAKLETLETQDRGTDVNDHSLNAVGALLLWQGWTARTRRHLNSELAHVLAKKLIAMDRVRVAFGRKRAVELMQKAERYRSKKHRSKHQETNLVT